MLFDRGMHICPFLSIPSILICRIYVAFGLDILPVSSTVPEP
jgi:hypothetical protein